MKTVRIPDGLPVKGKRLKENERHMIRYIKGTVNLTEEGGIILECSGIGYKISMPASSLYKLSEGDEAKVYTYMSVKEDGISLYGFMTAAEEAMFELLIGVSGIGPKGALAILSSISIADLKTAVAAEDSKLIASAKGVGSKTAQKIVLELKGKTEKEVFAQVSSKGGDLLQGSGVRANTAQSGAIDVLEALGFSRSAAVRAVNNVAGSDKLTSEAIVNEALKIIE